VGRQDRNKGHLVATTYTICDLTQSYAANGGGIRTYLAEKRAFIDRQTPHRHLLIVPGERDRIIEDGRHRTIEISSPCVPGSPNYRLLLRSRAVLKTLREQQPTIIECQCAYNLPWTAVFYRRNAPDVSLIAGYRTDFPSVYVERVGRKLFGDWVARTAKKIAYRYAGKLYSKFDGVYALNAGTADMLKGLGAGEADILPLGIDLQKFNPAQRDEDWRKSIGAKSADPVLIYVGRLDEEKRPDILADAFDRLPDSMHAHLILIGEGKHREKLKQRADAKRIHLPGFISDRAALARILASSDIYVSAMEFETFGISVIEAQAAGLPVIGVNGGAMPDRVPPALGMLGPAEDADAMAGNIIEMWNSGRSRMVGAAGRAHVETHFSWQRTFEHLLGHIYPKASGLRFLEEAPQQHATNEGANSIGNIQPDLNRPVLETYSFQPSPPIVWPDLPQSTHR